MFQRRSATQHRAAEIDRERVVPLFQLDGVEAESADPDPDIEHQAVKTAEAADGLFDHSVHIGFMRDIRLDRKGATTLGGNARNRVIRARTMNIRDRDMRALAR